MAKVRNSNDLFNELDSDFSWRLKEIADIKTSIKLSDLSKAKTLTRAGVALLYAHWEGFVKNAASKYLEFVSNQGLRYEQLQSCFVAIGFKQEIELVTSSKKYIKNGQAIEIIRSRMSLVANFKNEDIIYAESNLNSDVFEKIMTTIGLNCTWYETKYNLIDSILLKRRNNIAHGDYLLVDFHVYAELHDEVIILLRAVKADIENAALMKRYIK
jgi:hypothetical protein